MHARTITSVSALLLGAAVIGSPVFAADSVPGNKVAAPAVTRDAPASIPAGAKPLAVPQVDPSTLSRGPLGLDPNGAAESMATLTRSSDGSETETPASQALRDVLAEAVKGNNPDAGNTSRVVTGPDDRTQITDTNSFPAATVGWIVGQTQKGDYYTCTGTLIGPQSVITAAHCVYDHESGGWAKDLVFVPGATDAQTAPFGVFEWDNANILKGYVSNYDGKNYGSSMPWDLAEITLKQDAGNQIGWQGFRVDDGTDFKAISMGYPGDKPDGTMWTETCDIPAANFGDQVFIHNCDTYAGSSGSSMWEDAGKGDLYIRGINVAEDDKENWGVRLIQPYFQFIQDNYK